MKSRWHGMVIGRIAGLPLLTLVCFVSVCLAAPQSAAPQLQRFTVLRAGRLLGPSVELTAAEANCAINGNGDSATMKCQPVGVTSKNAYTYYTALVAQADGTAYIIACRIGLVSNLWCKSLAEGRILRGTMTGGRLTVPDGDKSRDYLVLQTAQIGPIDIAQPAAPETPANGRAAAQAPLPPRSQAAAPPWPQLGDFPAACVSANAALSANSACVSFVSEPQGADIYVDGKFVGSTPSMMPLTAGTHKIRIEAAQRTPLYKPWTRTLQTTAAGKITIHADLEPAPAAK